VLSTLIFGGAVTADVLLSVALIVGGIFVTLRRWSWHTALRQHAQNSTSQRGRTHVPNDGRLRSTYFLLTTTSVLSEPIDGDRISTTSPGFEGFDPETKEHAADGVVAYSAICVHTGCDVTNWHPDQQLLECPCHYSTYDPKEDAKVVADQLHAVCRRCPWKSSTAGLPLPSRLPAGPASNKS